MKTFFFWIGIIGSLLCLVGLTFEFYRLSPAIVWLSAGLLVYIAVAEGLNE